MAARSLFLIVSVRFASMCANTLRACQGARPDRATVSVGRDDVPCSRVVARSRHAAALLRSSRRVSFSAMDSSTTTDRSWSSEILASAVSLSMACAAAVATGDAAAPWGEFESLEYMFAELQLFRSAETPTDRR